MEKEGEEGRDGRYTNLPASLRASSAAALASSAALAASSALFVAASKGALSFLC